MLHYRTFLFAAIVFSYSAVSWGFSLSSDPINGVYVDTLTGSSATFETITTSNLIGVKEDIKEISLSFSLQQCIDYHQSAQGFALDRVCLIPAGTWDLAGGSLSFHNMNYRLIFRGAETGGIIRLTGYSSSEPGMELDEANIRFENLSFVMESSFTMVFMVNDSKLGYSDCVVTVNSVSYSLVARKSQVYFYNTEYNFMKYGISIEETSDMSFVNSQSVGPGYNFRSASQGRIAATGSVVNATSMHSIYIFAGSVVMKKSTVSHFDNTRKLLAYMGHLELDNCDVNGGGLTLQKAELTHPATTRTYSTVFSDMANAISIESGSMLDSSETTFTVPSDAAASKCLSAYHSTVISNSDTYVNCEILAGSIEMSHVSLHSAKTENAGVNDVCTPDASSYCTP